MTDWQWGDNASFRAGWLTDLHLNEATEEDWYAILDWVHGTDMDALFLTGDYADGQQFLGYFTDLPEKIPTYFVLGNHDYYDSSIQETREIAAELPEVYLTEEEEPIRLTEDLALIGHDGWSDGRCGNFLESPLLIKDYVRIDDLVDLSQEQRLAKLYELGSEAASALRERLLKAFRRYQRVVVLTHHPPFREACRYNNEMASDDWAPHFVCMAVGEMLREVMERNQNREVLVLCGHAHHGADEQILPNLHVRTGKSKTGAPKPQGILTLG